MCFSLTTANIEVLGSEVRGLEVQRWRSGGATLEVRRCNVGGLEVQRCGSKVQRWRSGGATVQFKGPTLEVGRWSDAVPRCSDGGRRLQRWSSEMRRPSPEGQRWRSEGGRLSVKGGTMRFKPATREVGRSTVVRTLSGFRDRFWFGDPRVARDAQPWAKVSNAVGVQRCRADRVRVYNSTEPRAVASGCYLPGGKRGPGRSLNADIRSLPLAVLIQPSS